MPWWKKLCREKRVRWNFSIRGGRLCGPILIIAFFLPLLATAEVLSLHSPVQSDHNDGLGRSESWSRERRVTGADPVVIYRRYCLRCHGAEGDGISKGQKTPQIPDFTSSTWEVRRSDVQLATSITEGKGRFMPAFGDRLHPEEIQALVRYVRGFRPPEFKATNDEADDFDVRFRWLEEELNELRKQFRELSHSRQNSSK
jgi:hypothetical protein